MPNTPDPLVICLPLPYMLLLYMFFNRTIKGIICWRIVSYDSFNLLFNIVVLKDWEEDRELIIAAIAKYHF